MTRRARAINVCFLLIMYSVTVSADLPDGTIGKWGMLPSLPDPIGFAGPFAGTSGRNLIVAGGANFPAGPPWEGHPKVWSDQVFTLSDPAEKWQLAGHLPRPLGYGVSVTVDDAVICLGGSDARQHHASVFRMRFTSAGLKFERLPDLPEPRAMGCGAVIGKTIYYAGGLKQPDSATTGANFWALDLSAAEPSWKSLPTWPGPPRMLAVAGSLQGDFSLFSGTDLIPGGDGKPTRKYLRDAYRFSPGSGWTRLADLPEPVVAAPSPAIPWTRTTLLIPGGDSGSLYDRNAELKDRHPGFLQTVLEYDVVANRWREAGRLPPTFPPADAKAAAVRVFLPVTTSAVVWQNRFVIPSGEVRPGVRTNHILTLDPMRVE